MESTCVNHLSSSFLASLSMTGWCFSWSLIYWYHFTVIHHRNALQTLIVLINCCLPKFKRVSHHKFCCLKQWKEDKSIIWSHTCWLNVLVELLLEQFYTQLCITHSSLISKFGNQTQRVTYLFNRFVFICEF